MPTHTATHIAKGPQAKALTKALSKSVSVSAQGKTADPDKTKISAILKRNSLIMDKGQLITRYIKHLAESANFKGSIFNKHRKGLLASLREAPFGRLIGNRYDKRNCFIHPSLVLCN